MFSVGQKVICIKTHSQGAVKKDITYTVYNIKPSQCKCKALLVDVGIPSSGISGCIPCDYIYGWDSAWWIKSTLFAPIQEEKGSMTYEDALMIVNESININ